MRIELPSNSEMWVSIRHEVPTRTVARRSYFPHHTFKDIEARCHPKDQFSRRVGRRLVADRVLADMREHGFSKEDRKVVFEKLCPEFGEQS